MFFDLFNLLDLKFFVGFIKNGVFPLKLSDEEEEQCIKDLFNQEKHDEARTKLITHNLRLVAHIAKKYENKDDSTADMISIGTLGLIKAIDTYSLDKKVKLATYAAKCVENEILMTMRSNKKYSKDVSFFDSIGVDKDGQEIALIDVIPSNDVPLDQAYDHQQKIEKLRQYLNVLDDRELEIITLRYGLNNTKDYTQKEISKLYNISRSYVSRIEKRALIKLLQEFKKNH